MIDEPIRVLHVDDSPALLELSSYKLGGRDGIELVCVTDPSDALSQLSTVDCIVSDLEMPGMDGFELLERVRQRDPSLPFILFTGKGSEEIASEAISQGVTDYLRKRTGTDQFDVLENRIRNAVEGYRSRQALEAEKRRTERILEASPVGIVVHDRAGDVILANDRARRLLGGSDSSLAADHYDTAPWTLYTLDGALVPAEQLPYRCVVDTGESIHGVEYVLEIADGREERIRVNGAPLLDGDDIEGVVIAFEIRNDNRGGGDNVGDGGGDDNVGDGGGDDNVGDGGGGDNVDDGGGDDNVGDDVSVPSDSEPTV